ncbi:MAG: hypothetical protein ACKV0T_06075 [Planctomycetales bacterium]
MKRLFDWVMSRRARQLMSQLRHLISPVGPVADVGSGSGHNAECWRCLLNVEVDEYDVADLHWVGGGPILWDGVRIPAANGEYPLGTLLYVLQYARRPTALLREMSRICSGRVVVLQSTYQGRRGGIVLALREFVWGRLAFYLARSVRVIRRQTCPLIPRRYFTRETLRRRFARAGFRVVAWESREWKGLNVSRDLYVLEPIRKSQSCP